MSASVIRGSRDLPPGFDHPHASEEGRRAAETGLLLRTQGSVGHRAAVDRADHAASHLSAEPDRAWVDDWLHRSHLASWS